MAEDFERTALLEELDRRSRGRTGALGLADRPGAPPQTPGFAGEDAGATERMPRIVDDGVTPTLSLDAPGEMRVDAPAAASRVSDRDYVMGLLEGKAYGPDSLAAIEPQLKERGIQLQKDSQGRTRGRIKLANGDIVDLPGAGEGLDWWNNPQAGGFTWTHRGQEGLDAGGWSFGGGKAAARSFGGTAAGDTTAGAIQTLMPTDGDFTRRLQDELARILGGPSALDREALLRQLGA